MRFPLLPAFLALLSALALPVNAAQTLPTRLRPDAGPQLRAERTMKSLLDEWTHSAFDVGFDSRGEADLTRPGEVRVRLDNLTLAFSPTWWQRYKRFYDDLVAQPYASETLSHARTYVRLGERQLQARLIDGRGQVLYSAGVTHTVAPSHDAAVESTLFNPLSRRSLPGQPPALTPGFAPAEDPPYFWAPASAVKAARRIRLSDMLPREWPVALTDPLKATPPRRLRNPVSVPLPSRTSSAFPPSPPVLDAAPLLPAPRLQPSPR